MTRVHDRQERPHTLTVLSRVDPPSPADRGDSEQSMTAPARRVDREWHEQPTVIVVTYRNGQPERVKPNFQSASRAGVPDGVVHQLASHEHRVLTHRQKLPIHTSRLDEQTCP